MTATRTIAVIGVPWSVHELAPAVEDASAARARILLVDTPAALARRDPALDLDAVPVASLDAETAYAAIRGLQPDCIVAITELEMENAARVRELAGRRGTSSATERAVQHKPSTRAALFARGLTAVQWWETTIGEVALLAPDLPLPLVLKPAALTGSAGVLLLRTPEDVRRIGRQYDEETARRFARDRLLLETFVPGDEVSAEGLVVNGALTLFTITDKVNSGAPHFYETGHVMPSRFDVARRQAVHAYLQQCIDALGVVTSPIHAELKLDGESIELIELHTRFGGDNIVRLLEEAFGFRPYRAYFEAMLDGRTAPVRPPLQVCGVAFFTGAIGHDAPSPRFAFPHPEAVVSIDYDRRRTPKLESFEGVKLLYWRAGEAFFASRDYQAVFQNVESVARERIEVAAPAEAM